VSRALVWSYGGGTQSVAIAVLIWQRRLPVPECIVIADTGRERARTWEYMEQHVQSLMLDVGATIEVAPHNLATVDLHTKSGSLLIPAFTRPAGKLPTFCSNEWKRRVVSRFLRQKGYGPNRPVRQWLGYSVDEVGRAKPSDVRWIEQAWPLLFDVPLRRDECRALVEAAGLPTPPRSSCFMCPYHSDNEWRKIRDEEPADWERAVQFDSDIRGRDPNVFLHRKRVPLTEISLDHEAPQQDVFGGVAECESGYCFV
jgi:hypothetical protein